MDCSYRSQTLVMLAPLTSNRLAFPIGQLVPDVSKSILNENRFDEQANGSIVTYISQTASVIPALNSLP